MIFAPLLLDFILCIFFFLVKTIKKTVGNLMSSLLVREGGRQRGRERGGAVMKPPDE